MSSPTEPQSYALTPNAARFLTGLALGAAWLAIWMVEREGERLERQVRQVYEGQEAVRKMFDRAIGNFERRVKEGQP